MHHLLDDWNDEPHQLSTAEPHQTTWVKRLKQTFLQHWQPKPLPAPVVDRDLPTLTGIERTAEVCRFILSKIEYTLSPLGHLREFIKLNVRLSIAIAIPVLMVAPLVTMALEQMKAWIHLLTETMSSFVLFPLSVVLSILLVCGMMYIGRSLLEMRMRSQHRERYY